jgi:pimeloyl-ACP methyl ester carboxylesterase
VRSWLFLVALALACEGPLPPPPGAPPYPVAAMPEDRFLQRLARMWVRPRRRSRAVHAPADGVDRVLEVAVEDALLEAWLFLAEGPRPRDGVDTVVLLHGLGDSKTPFGPVGRRLSAAGHTVVAVDLRGHGASTGARLGYGAWETEDLARVLDALEAEGVAVGEVGVYGPSYGGHIALQWAGQDRRVARVLTVGTYRSVRSTFPEYVRHFFPRWADLEDAQLDRGVDLIGQEGGFDVDRASAMRWLPRARADVWLIHGTEDQHVPLAHADRLAASCPERCTVIPYAGRDHLGSFHGPLLSQTLDRVMAGREPGAADR